LGFADNNQQIEKQIQSLWNQIKQHLGKIAESPNSQDVPGWKVEIRGWIEQIAKKAGKVTLKRRSGALDKYLMRVIGVTEEELKNINPSPVIIVNPCLINPGMPSCRVQRSPLGPA